MQKDDILSKADNPAYRGWRYAHSSSPPIRKPADLEKRRDLGSDDEWQLTMGSDSDADDTDKLQPAVQSHDPDQQPPIHPLESHNLPNSSILPNPQFPSHSQNPVHACTPDPSTETDFIAGFDAHLNITKPTSSITDPASREKQSRLIHLGHPQPYHTTDLYNHHSTIPHPAVAHNPVSPRNPSGARPAAWADRPRGNPVPLAVSQTPGETLSGGRSPVMTNAARAESDSALNSQGNSNDHDPASALRPPARAVSDASDSARLTTAKSVTFDTQDVESSTSSSALLDHHNSRSQPPNKLSASSLTSEKSSSSGKANERKASGFRLSFRDSKARLSAARLSASKRQQQRLASFDTAIRAQQVESEITAQPPLNASEDPPLPALPAIPQHRPGESSTVGTITNEHLSANSEGTDPRRRSELSQESGQNERPTSMQPPASSPNFETPLASDILSALGPNGPMTPVLPTGFAKIPSQTGQKVFKSVQAPSKDISHLECVVECLKGMTAYRRKGFMSIIEGQIWLTPDMAKVEYRMAKKGTVPVTHSLPVSRIRKLKGIERELTIEMIGQKKSIDFLFPLSRPAFLWTSALCCLMPLHSTVKCENRKIELRKNYNFFEDSWNGKPLPQRKRLNQFILLGSIGRGSFGKVKLSLSYADGQFYAVKVLSKWMMRRRMRSAPFDRSIREAPEELTVGDVNEIVVMKALNHENVMKMEGVFDDENEDHLYIVVEFLPKGPIMSSSKLTGADTISEDQARTAFVDVLCGLEYLHRNHIAHRDIKPDNLLQAGNGTVKISDFGAAILYKDENGIDLDNSQSQNSTVGTPAFTAPELCLSEKSPRCPARCYAADIWSLGASLFYMIYGQAPFIARSIFEMYETICSQDLVFPEEAPPVSRNLQNLIREMLQKSPEDRATITSIIRSPWLTEHVEVADKLAKIRSALLQHSHGRGTNNRGT